MTTFCILCQLNTPWHDYQALIDAISQLGACLYCLEHTWLTVTARSASEISELLMPHLHENDKLMVFAVGSAWAVYGFDPFCQKWIRNHWHPLRKIKGDETT